MNTAIKILEKYYSIHKSIKESENTLKFGKGAIGVSDIAQQYFCEKELELDYEYPQEQTKAMKIGGEGHENITSLALPVTIEQAIKDALVKRNKPKCIYEFAVAWIYKKVPILGNVDEVWFQNGKAISIIERKFTNSLIPYPSHQVQARLYCLGLDDMGFNTSTTTYTIMLFKNKCHDCVNLADRSCSIFRSTHDYYKCKNSEVKQFTCEFSKTKALEELNWALDFWLNQRNATSSNNHNKCNACRQRDNCEYY